MEFLSLEKFFLHFHLPHQPLPDQLPKLPLSPKMFVTKPCFPSRCSKPPWLSKECRWALVNDDLWLSAGQGRSGHGWWVQWLACSYFVAPTFCFSSRFIFDFSSEKGSPSIWAPPYVCQPPLGWVRLYRLLLSPSLWTNELWIACCGGGGMVKSGIGSTRMVRFCHF